MTYADRLAPPFLLRVGAFVARWVAWLLLLQVGCYPFGALHFTFNGTDLAQSTVGRIVVPSYLLLAVFLLLVSYGIRHGHYWVRWVAIAFWAVPLVALAGVLPWPQYVRSLPSVIGSLLVGAGPTLAYLFFSPAVRAYYERADQLRRADAAFHD